MKQFMLGFPMLLLAMFCRGEDYPVAAIPKSMLANANAVIRLYEQTVEIRSVGKVTLKEHYIITILNEAGERYAGWSEYYDKLRSVSDIEGTLYDARGKKIRSMKKNELIDRPYTSEISLIEDNRVKIHDFNHKVFPYTVEYSATITSNQTMFLPQWSAVPGRLVSVEKSTFTVIADEDFTYRYKCYNIAGPSATEERKGTKVTRWEVANQPAIIGEFAAPALHELAPYVVLAPNEFKLGDVKGSFATWSEYGKFTQKLIEGLDELPQETKTKVHAITAKLKTDREKVEALYRYMQKNTHYISIQIGVGGWRPFPASYVAQKGYGDCKALSNFMIAMLKEVGIKGNYIVIRAGENEPDMSIDFPVLNSNHVICAVPLAKDTIWLECTSQSTAPGYMGSFTGNRHALMVTEDGGKVVKTPTYTKQDNMSRSLVQAKVDPTGNLSLQAKNSYQACSSDDLHQRIHHYSKEEQLKYLKKYLDIAHYDITGFSYEEINGRLPFIIEKYDLTAPHYAQVTGKRLFLVPNVLNRWSRKLATDTARMYDIVLPEERIEADTAVIEIPQGYQPESMPKPVEIKTAYGTYNSNTLYKNNQVIYYRRLELNKGRFKAKEYMDLARFYEQIYKADRAKAVLVKTE